MDPKVTAQGNQTKASGLTRRDLFARAAGGAAAAALGVSALEAAEEKHEPKGRVRQSVCKWCYGKFSIEELARHSAAIGL